MTDNTSNESNAKPGDDVTSGLTAENSSFNEYDEQACAEFQAHMSERIGSGEDLSVDPHLKSCARCSGLMRELEAIADAAREFMNFFAEPSEKVWVNIDSALKTQDPSDEDDAASAPEPPSGPPSRPNLPLEAGTA